jgi:hypothetical protein
MTSLALKTFLLVIPMLLFSVAFAATTELGGANNTGKATELGGANNTGKATELGGPNLDTGKSVTLKNPLGNKTLMQFIKDILGVVMVFAVPIIVFFIIYAGFNYVMARGDTGKIETAHKALLYAVVGGLIILGAWVIMEVIQGTVDAFRR